MADDKLTEIEQRWSHDDVPDVQWLIEELKRSRSALFYMRRDQQNLLAEVAETDRCQRRLNHMELALKFIEAVDDADVMTIDQARSLARVALRYDGPL
jgi:hypothetical protein